MGHLFQELSAIVAFVGYDTRVQDSRQKSGRRHLSKRGPAELRRLLFVAAMAAAKTKNWKPIYAHYRAKGLSTTAALCVIARNPDDTGAAAGPAACRRGLASDGRSAGSSFS